MKNEELDPIHDPSPLHGFARVVRGFSKPFEWLTDRVYSSRWNPLHQSGVLALMLLLVSLVSGIYLLFFYSVADPHGSVVRISEQSFSGRWIRSLHRFASDGVLVATGFHVLKMMATGRTWGKRMRAWVSGVLLTLGLLVCGISGLVLVWDQQAQLILIEFTRMLDILPLFSEPLSGLLAGESLRGGIFFATLFLHVAVPLVLAGLFLVHVSRVARPTTRLPKPMLIHVLVVLGVGCILFPVATSAPADLQAVPTEYTWNLFFAGWLPLALKLPPAALWVLVFGSVALALSVPLWMRPKARELQQVSPPSEVDPNSCTGCTQCVQDCPYEAISMVVRTGPTADGRHSELVALVDPDLCVSCGICAASCKPMGVGPAGRTGRDQFLDVKDWFEQERPVGRLVVVGCHQAAATPIGVTVYPVRCAGSVHTSVLEYLVRKGALGVYFLSCPDRDCSHREGPKWARMRVYEGREADLHTRVDRRRIRLGGYSYTEALDLARELREFQAYLKETFPVTEGERSVSIDLECETEESVEAELECEPVEGVV